MKRRRQEAKPTCEEVHDGGGQGQGDRGWNDDWDGTGELERGGTGELGWDGRLALSDVGEQAHVEALGGRRKAQGGGRKAVQVGRMVVRAGRSSPQDGTLWAPGCTELVQDAGGGRWLVLDGKEWVLDDKGLVLDGNWGLARCILGGRSAARPRTQLWPGNRRCQLCRSRSAGIDTMAGCCL